MKSVTELPFNQFIGLRSEGESGSLALPSGSQYLNHIGTVHAGAQLALAEAASGEFLLRELGTAEGLLPVVRRMEAKFRKPANGALSAAASASAETLEQLRADLAARGRALIEITVELRDESGTHALSATVEWFVQALRS